MSCHMCDNLVFPSWSKLDSHCKNEHQCQPHLLCAGCATVLKTYGNYKYHLKKCCVSTYQCDLCPYNYSLKKKLESHMLQRHSVDSVRYICKTCNKESFTSHQLEEHERSHLPENLRKIFPCPTCNLQWVIIIWVSV